MAIAVFFLAVIASSLLAGFESGEPMLSFFLFVPLLMLFIIHHAGAPVFIRIFFTIFLAVFVTIPFAGLLSQSFLYIVLPPFLSTLIAPVIIQSIRRYSAEGRKLRSEIDGYREFIDKVEADRIAKLSEEDPLFFYHVLPYAMVFGLADKWCDVLCEEFWRQGDMELANGLPISSSLNERGKGNKPKGQVGFYNIVCLPLYQAIARIFPELEVNLEAVKSNLEVWKKLAAESDKDEETQQEDDEPLPMTEQPKEDKEDEDEESEKKKS